MPVLLRFLARVFIIWLICYFFYSLGKKHALKKLKGRTKKGDDAGGRRKIVESSVVEKENHTDDVDDKR